MRGCWILDYLFLSGIQGNNDEESPVAVINDTIVHEGEYRMGLQFKEISEGDRAVIRDYVQK